MSLYQRRDFLKKSFKGLAGIGLLGMIDFIASCKRKIRPNFLIFIADDLGWSDTGLYNPNIHTGNLNKIAAYGLQLTRFYVQPIEGASLLSFLTGKFASRFGFIAPDIEVNMEKIVQDGNTLPQILRSNGYETAFIGKWTLGTINQSPLERFGFNYSYGLIKGKDKKERLHRNGKPIKAVASFTDLIEKEAVHYLTSLRDKMKPFFLMIPFNMPHSFYNEESKWINLYKKVFKDEEKAIYAASITHMDHAIGKILDAIKDEGLQTNTLVLFFSDNGAKLMLPQNKYKINSNRPFRGEKGQLYEGGIHVPALMLWFTQLHKGVRARTIHVADMYPTIAKLAGISINQETRLDGLNVWSTIKNNKPVPERVLYWRTKTELAIRKGKWKLINKGPTPFVGKAELYNINSDPGESIDFSLDYPQIVARLTGELKKQYIKESSL
ncbi:MAG: sulfatase-like hydrolase/transferase [Caldisericaceae bacterium]|nr:sulfatase-like hydrolase/transferase [Caldisericaceae bacterium]